MSTSYVRNHKGQAIGILTILASGVIQIRNSSGILLGWYEPNSDKTIEAKSGNWFGYGNQLTLLLNK